MHVIERVEEEREIMGGATTNFMCSLTKKRSRLQQKIDKDSCDHRATDKLQKSGKIPWKKADTEN